MGLGKNKIHPERKGYGRRTERKIVGDKARRMVDRIETREQFDAAMSEWHDADTDLTACEWLGMDWETYRSWVEPPRTLRSIVPHVTAEDVERILKSESFKRYCRWRDLKVQRNPEFAKLLLNYRKPYPWNKPEDEW